MTKKILQVRDLSVRFMGVHAVRDVSFCVNKKETVALIGSNGAGKTTVFHMLTGYTKPDFGSILLRGRDITKKNPSEISKAGIARTFQNIRLFSQMTVLENVQIALEGKQSLLFRTPLDCREQAYGILDTYGLSAQAHKIAGSLPYGEKRRLELARAMATEPTLLLLDEPAAGQNHEERMHLMNCLQKIRTQIPILFIEHDMPFVRALASRAIAMHHGSILCEGSPDFVLSDPKVKEAYLGGSVC